MCGIEAKIASRSGSAFGLRCSPGTTRTRKMHSESNAGSADTKTVSCSRNTCHDSVVVHHTDGLGGVLCVAECSVSVDAYGAFPQRIAAATNAVHCEKT